MVTVARLLLLWDDGVPTKKKQRTTASVAPIVVLAAVIDLVIGTNFDLHRVPIWDHHGDKVIRQGENLTLTCSLAGLKFFDVLRVTHVQGATTRTLSDNANVKIPYSRIPRYSVHHVYNSDMATVSISYHGIRGEDSGRLGCLKLGEHDDSARYVTLQVLAPVKEVYVISISANGQEKRLEVNDSEIFLEEKTLLGLGCISTLDGSPVPPTVRVTIAGEDKTNLFFPMNETHLIAQDSPLSSFQSEVKLTMQTKLPNINFNGKIMKCTAFVNGFDPVAASARLVVRYVPRIRCNDIFEAKLGGNTTIICQVQSNPGSQLRWMQGGQRKQVVSGKDDFVISDKPMERDSNEAKLSIIHIREHHFTSYILKATNDIGTQSQPLQLRKKIPNPEPQPPGHSGRSVDTRNSRHKSSHYSRNSANFMRPVTLLKTWRHIWTTGICAILLSL